MSQPNQNAALNAEARQHLLELVAAGYTSHDALQSDDKRTALIEIDKVIAHAHEARKFLLGKTPTIATSQRAELLEEKSET